MAGNVVFKPMQRDLLTGDLVKGKPKSGNGRHIRLHRAVDEPVVNPGMAHFAGTGPEKTYCKECAHCKDLPVYRNLRFISGSLAPGQTVAIPKRHERDACEKAAILFDNIVQRGGIQNNRACKYFERKEQEGQADSSRGGEAGATTDSPPTRSTR